MEKFEYILSKFIKNPYSNIKITNSFNINFRYRFFLIFYLFPLMVIIFSLAGYFTISIAIDENYLNFSQFYFLELVYKYLFCIIPIFYIISIKNYFHIKYKVLGLRTILFSFAVSFFILLIFFPFSLLFIIQDIKPNTIYIYYSTAIILFIIYYFDYKKRWIKHIFINNYSKYKKEILKPTFPEDSMIGKFNLDLKENENKKPIFTKVWEFTAVVMLRFGLTIPVLASISGSGMIKYEGMIYFCIYLFLFMIPYFAKIISSGIIFNLFIKQIEKEKNVTIYNGKKVDSK